MKIVLGAFSNTFYELKSKHNAIEYADYGWIDGNNKHPNCPFPSIIVSDVCHNLDACTECVFDVTHLRLPFNEGVITLKELYVVIHNDEYFNKTTFFVNSKPINKNKLKELFIINEPIAFKDYSEMFIEEKPIVKQNKFLSWFLSFFK